MRRLLPVALVVASLSLSACGPQRPEPTVAPPVQAPRPVAPATAVPPPHGMPQSKSDAKTTSRDATVYITRTGKKYHRKDCQYLDKSSAPMARTKAQTEGYTPCTECNPG